MNLALAHEYFVAHGGAERVVETLHQMWPEAPVYTFFHDQRRYGHLPGWTIRTSYLQRLLLGESHRLLLPLYPNAARALRVPADVDVALVSTSAFIKGISLADRTVEIAYCHSPTRYLWDWSDRYLEEEVPAPLHGVVRELQGRLRDADRAAASRVDRWLANSRVVAERIRRYYDRDSEVVYPPIDVEAFACNHGLPIAWAEKGVRKQDDLRPHLRRMEKRQQYGIYFILKSMEQGSTFRSTPPKYPTVDPHYRLLAKQRSRFTHYYFYLRDEVLGPMVMRVASFFPFHTTYYLNGHNFIAQELNRQGVVFRQHDNAFLATANPQALQAAADRFTPERIRERLEYWTLVLGPKFSHREREAMNLRRFYAVRQVEYCRIFKRSFPIHRLFERSCELGVWRWTSDHFSQVFGIRVTRRLRGKLHTTLEKIEHGHHVFRAYWKNAFVKQYEKFLTFLRAEVCSNNLRDFGLKKGLEHLAAVRCSFLGVLDDALGQPHAHRR